MKIPKSQLLPVLQRLITIAGQRTTIPGLNAFHIIARKGEMKILSNSLDEYLEVTIPADGDLDLCVNAAQFTNLVGAIGEKIELIQKDDKLVVKSNGVAELSLMPVQDFPAWAAVKETKIGLNTADLAKLIDSVSWISQLVDPKAADFTTVIHIMAAKHLRVDASSRTVIISNFIPSIAADCSALIDHRFVKNCCAVLAEKEATLSLSDNYLAVQSATSYYRCKLSEVSFPDAAIQEIFATKADMVGKLLSDELMPHLDLCSSFARDRYDYVNLEFSGDGMALDFRNNPTAGDAPMTYSTKIKGKFQPFITRLSLRYLRDAVKCLSGSAAIEIHSGPQRIYLSCADKPHICIGSMHAT